MIIVNEQKARKLCRNGAIIECHTEKAYRKSRAKDIAEQKCDNGEALLIQVTQDSTTSNRTVTRYIPSQLVMRVDGGAGIVMPKVGG